MRLIDTYNAILLQEYSNKFIQQLIGKFKKESPTTDDFTLLKYIEQFDKIKSTLPPDKRDITTYTWPNLKNTILNNFNDKHKNLSVKFKNVLPVYNKNNLEIYLANSKEACIYYGTGYNFCISSRGKDNLYFNYRFEDDEEDNTIYFVFDKDKTTEKDKNGFLDPTHLLVILVPRVVNYNDTDIYLLSFASNSGEEPHSWSDICHIQPKLCNLQRIFKPVDAIKKEKLLAKIELDAKRKLDNLNKLYSVAFNNDKSNKIDFDDLKIESTIPLIYKRVTQLLNGEYYKSKFITYDNKIYKEFISFQPLSELEITSIKNIITNIDDGPLIMKVEQEEYYPHSIQKEYLLKVLNIFRNKAKQEKIINFETD